MVEHRKVHFWTFIEEEEIEWNFGSRGNYNCREKSLLSIKKFFETHA